MYRLWARASEWYVGALGLPVQTPYAGRNLRYPQGYSVHIGAAGQPRLEETVTSNTLPFRHQAWGQELSSALWWAVELWAHQPGHSFTTVTDPYLCAFHEG